MTHEIHCAKLNKIAEGLSAPPFPGTVGQKIYETVSKQAWDLWLEHQTMLINEYRLSLIDPQTKAFLEQEMNKFLFGEGSTKPDGYIAPETS